MGYEPTGNTREFGIKLSQITINGLTLTAQASSPTRIRVGESDDLHIVIPLEGGAETTTAAGRFRWRANEAAALFSAEGDFLGLSERKATVSAKLDAKRCQAILHSMRSNYDQINMSGIFETRIVLMKHGQLSFTGLIKRYIELVDSILPNEKAARILGLDDVFYRHVALMIAPEIFLSESNPENKLLTSSQKSVDAICDIARNPANNLLTLTEMERISGLSARTLQYAFRRRFGCSPLEWQRRERLYLAKAMLMSASETINITSTCYQTGFASPSKFTEYYRRQFGETPSETVRRARGKIN